MAWQGLDILPHNARIPFIRVRHWTYFISGALSLLSLVLFFLWGPAYGVDFNGGTLIEIRNNSGPVNLSDLRGKLGGLGLSGLQIQGFGTPEDALIRVETQEGGELAQQAVVDKIRAALGDTVAVRRVEVVGPAVSQELRTSGLWALGVSMLAIMAYVWFRFEWQFAIGAVLATLHDVTMAVGLFCVTRLEFDITVVAAILTIIGYSLNDTVVVYDRIRENLRKYKKMPLQELLDLSINETLSRTIMTSVTVFLSVLALFLFGGPVIRNFSIAMMWGVFVGTYSSIFIAAPLLMLFDVKRDWSGVAKAKEPAGSKA